MADAAGRDPSAIVERVARALCKADLRNPDAIIGGGLGPSPKERYYGANPWIFLQLRIGKIAT